MPIASDRILYEDEHLLAVNKLCGELVVKGKGKVGKLPLLDFLKQDYPGIKAIHRLDFETSGVVVFAKNAEVERKILSNKFDQWRKTYTALLMGRIAKKQGAIRKKLPARERGLVEAETLYTVLDLFGNSTLVECVITTGRHHQIRRHFASIDHPLVLDREYGHGKFNQLFRQELGFSKFFLHAAEISFPHPMTEEIVRIKAPMPKSFAACVKKLRTLAQ
jgi:23S rRNA pseudouridine955/2504/2580 synthase|tara:strand:- start:40866 stop:41525 length:660 start_codon:yes stop_codon:yes gene_type:complete